jgi:hypothetical protein
LELLMGEQSEIDCGGCQLVASHRQPNGLPPHCSFLAAGIAMRGRIILNSVNSPGSVA